MPDQWTQKHTVDPYLYLARLQRFAVDLPTELNHLGVALPLVLIRLHHLVNPPGGLARSDRIVVSLPIDMALL